MPSLYNSLLSNKRGGGLELLCRRLDNLRIPLRIPTAHDFASLVSTRSRVRALHNCRIQNGGFF